MAGSDDTPEEEIRASAAPKAPPTITARSAASPSGGDPLEALLRRGDLHRYLSWLVDAPRFVDGDTLSGCLAAAVPADVAIDLERARAVAGKFPENPALGWLLELVCAAERPEVAGLAALVVHYLARSLSHGLLPERWLLHGPIGDPQADLAWLTEAPVILPRTLLLLDFQPGVTLHPGRLGFASGQVHLADPAHRQNPEKAIGSVVSSCGPLHWMNLHAPVGEQTLTLHLRGALNGGEVARLFFERGRRFGVRVIGTLHEGLTVNVLAVYEP